MPALRRVRRFLGPALVLVAAVFLGRALWSGFAGVREYEWRFELPYLLLSIALIFLYYLQQWGGWRLIMHSFEDPLTPLESAAIWFASILGRYVPGNVALVAGRIVMCRRRGIPATTTFASMVYEQALILLSAFLVAALSVPLWPPFEYKNLAALLVLLAPVGLLFLHPRIFSQLSNTLLLRFGRDPLEATLPFGRVLLLLLYFVGGWVLMGLAFAALVASLTPVSVEQLPLLVGGYAFAWEVGFLVLVTPGGLGVREVALQAILVLVFPLPVAAAVVVLARLWQTLAEVSAAAVVWAAAGRKGFTGAGKGRAPR